MTIVNRRTFAMEPGSTDEALELLATEGNKIDFPGPVRIYSTHTGPYDTVVVEYEFASLAEYEQFWTGWFAGDHWAEILPTWRRLTRAGGSNELFELTAKIG